jgi:hypothetical protein
VRLAVWPLGHVPYSQMAVRNPGWRTDCSGHVSMCLDLARPGLSTVTFITERYLHEITADETPACAPTGSPRITSSPATPSGSRHRDT